MNSDRDRNGYPLRWRGRNLRKAIAIWVATSITIVSIAIATPVLAQFAPIHRGDIAPILLDGRVLFHVSSVADFPATERAATINEILEEQLRFGEPISIEARVVEREGQTTLSMNDVHLLTVTLQDVKRRFGVWSEREQKTWLQKQAKNWGKRINAALQRAQKERSPAYIRQAALWTVGIVAVSIAVSWALTWVRRTLLLPRLQASTSTAQFKQQQRWRLALTGVQLGIWIAAVYSIMGLFPILRRGRYALFASLTRPIFQLGEVDGSILDLFVLLAFIVGLWFVVKGFTHFLKTQILSLAGVDRGGQNTIGLLTQYGLVALGLLVFFTSWGIDIASLAIVASAFGLGIGFGLQNIVSNFISGLIITFDRPIKVGDFIQLGNLMGTVEYIGSRSTEIMTLDQVSILVPNSRFVDGEVINWSYGNPVSRLKVPVGVAYGSPTIAVRKALLEAAKSHPEILRYPAPQVWLQEFGDSAIDFELLVWIREPQKQFKIKNELNYRIETSLRRYGIEIPFPQQDIYLRSPQFEFAIATWMKQNASPQDLADYQKIISQGETKGRSKELQLDGTLDSSAFKFGEEVDLDALVKQMRGIDGLELKDRRYGLSVYGKTFVGSEAVEWLMRTQKSGIKAAIQLGQLLIDRGIIHHVLDEHDFKNERLFYRFYVDE